MLYIKGVIQNDVHDKLLSDESADPVFEKRILDMHTYL